MYVCMYSKSATAGAATKQLGRLGTRRQRPQLVPKPIPRSQPPRQGRWTPKPPGQGPRRGDGNSPRDDPPPRSAGTQVGGCHVHLQLGQRVPDVLPDELPMGSDQPVVQGGHRMEGAERICPPKPHAAAEKRTFLLRMDQSAGTAPAHGRPPGSGFHQRGQSQRPHGRQHVGILAMGQQGEKTREGCPGAIGPCHGGSVGSADPGPLRLSGYHRSLSLPATSDVKPLLGCDPLHVGLAEQDAGESSDVHLCSPIVPQQLHPLGGNDDEAQPSGQVSLSPADRQAAPPHLSLEPSQALRIILCNQTSHCYANSSIVSLLWTTSQSPQGVVLASMAWHRLFRWMIRRPQSISLWSLTPWQTLMRSWPHPHRQNDVGEFLQHISFSLLSQPARGSWEARQLIDPTAPAQVADQGNMWQLILPGGLSTMHASAGAVSLQTLLIAWRCQAAMHAATVLPELAILQISRFHPDGSKDPTHVRLSEAVYIPVFSNDGVTTTSARYIVTAVIYHLGGSLLRGHYRAALVEQGRLCYQTDDNISAISHQPSETAKVEQNSYIFFLRKHV